MNDKEKIVIQKYVKLWKLLGKCKKNIDFVLSQILAETVRVREKVSDIKTKISSFFIILFSKTS